MPTIEANGITINYDRQGDGPPLVLIPSLAADHNDYGFQVPAYAERFTCFTLDPRGAGGTDKPSGPYSTELLADDVGAFMQAVGIETAHVIGWSMGAATALWVAAKYPGRVASLSLHGCWTKTDLYLKTVIESWQEMARALGSVTEMVIQAIFPWCFTPELYASRPDFLKSLAEFGRSIPEQPLEAFMGQSAAVIGHDATAQLEHIGAPTQITFGSEDALTSTRFAYDLQNGIADHELVIFDGCSHAPLYESVDEFNTRTLAFLERHAA